MTIVQPRLENITTFEMLAADLRAWGESIKSIAKMAFEGKGEQHPGDWWKFCRAKPVCKVSKKYAYDYLFITNERRVMTDKMENVSECIITSNLKGRVENAVCVNYSSYLCSDEQIADNPTLMMLNLLFSIGIRKVHIAGFDGFGANPDENYFEAQMSMVSNVENKIWRNTVTAKQMVKMRSKIEIDFLTPSRYI